MYEYSPERKSYDQRGEASTDDASGVRQLNTVKDNIEAEIDKIINDRFLTDVSF